MGYTKRGSITDFWPDDTEDTIYLVSSQSISEIQDVAKHKWGHDIDLENIEISSENIHTSCIYYDLHDPSDYTNFIVLTYKKDNK